MEFATTGPANAAALMTPGCLPRRVGAATRQELFFGAAAAEMGRTLAHRINCTLRSPGHAGPLRPAGRGSGPQRDHISLRNARRQLDGLSAARFSRAGDV